MAALSLVAGASAAFPACVHDDSTIFIQSVLAAQTSTQPGAICTYNADPMQPFISSGVLDLELKPEYEGEFLIGNQMVATANSSQLQTETSVATISHATVRITTADGRTELDRYTRSVTANIPPASGNTPGYASLGPVTIIDEKAVLSDPVQQKLVPGGTVRLLTFVRFSATTLGGQAVESNELQFPVDICRGCLITFTNNPLCPFPNCVANQSAGSTTSQPSVPCSGSIGQDLAVDCNTCANLGNLNCRGAFLGAPGTSCVVDAGGGGSGGGG